MRPVWCAIPPDHLHSGISFLRTCNIPNLIISHSPFNAWNISLVVCLHVTCTSCTKKRTIAQRRIFVEGTLLGTPMKCFVPWLGEGNVLFWVWRGKFKAALAENFSVHFLMQTYKTLSPSHHTRKRKSMRVPQTFQPNAMWPQRCCGDKYIVHVENAWQSHSGLGKDLYLVSLKRFIFYFMSSSVALT